MFGVTIDCHLNWSEHISNTCSKLQKCCYSLRFLKNHCSKHVLMRIYHANFHVLLRFNILNWGTCASLSRILILQKRAIRIICGIRPRDSCKPFFKELRVLTVTDTYVYEVCCYVFKNKKLFSRNNTEHLYATRARHNFLPDSHKTALYQRGLFYNGCKLFNAIPVHISWLQHYPHSKIN